MKHIVIAVSLFISLLPVAGCSTLADARDAKGTGTVRVYDKPYDVVWDAVVDTVKETSLAVVSESKSEGLILAQGAVGAFSWGENVAIYVEEVGDQVKTKVEVINKKALATNITAAGWEGRLSSALDERLAPEELE